MDSVVKAIILFALAGALGGLVILRGAVVAKRAENRDLARRLTLYTTPQTGGFGSAQYHIDGQDDDNS